MPKVYLDETGFDTFFYRPYAYARKGVSVKERISGRRYQRLSLVAAQTKEGLIAPMVYENTMDSALFETWFERFLLPALKQPSVIIMDNARFHRMAVLREWQRKKNTLFYHFLRIRLSSIRLKRCGQILNGRYGKLRRDTLACWKCYWVFLILFNYNVCFYFRRI